VSAEKSGFAGSSEEVEDVAVLLPERGVDSEYALEKAAAGFALRTESEFAQHHGVANGTLGGVVRRLNSLVVYEVPHCGEDLQQLLAGSGGLAVGGIATAKQQ
jgi:hypothetical protein